MLHLQNPNILMSDHSEDEVEEDQTISSLALSDSSSPVIASDDGTDMELSDDLDDNYADDDLAEPIPSEDVDLAGVTETTGEMLSYKLVGDNLDKNVRRSFQRMDRTTKSLHYFHTYGVRDRVSIAGMSFQPCQQFVSADLILPSSSDLNVLKRDFIILVSRCFNYIIHINTHFILASMYCLCSVRILVQHLKTFDNQRKDVVWHIPSSHTKEMSQKSYVVRNPSTKILA